MWLDLSIAISCAVAGLACGWVMRAVDFIGDADPNTLVTLADSKKVTDERLEQVAKGRISDVAGRLHDYAATMAMDVDAHQSRVQAVNNSLQQHEDDGSTDAVYRAVDELIAANDSMQEKLRLAQERIQEQAARLESAEQLANTDGLTRIANRRAFDDHLDQQFDLGPTEAGTLAVLDIDHFKQFNDTYGHRAGDEVLRVVASVLNARLNPYGIAARYGGEEFVVVLNGMPVQQAAEIVDFARAAIGERDIHFGDKRLRVTLSAGLAELLPEESKEDWLQRADDALYCSKGKGRNCAHWMDGTTPILVKPNPHPSVVPPRALEKESHPPGRDAERVDEPPRPEANESGGATLEESVDEVSDGSTPPDLAAITDDQAKGEAIAREDATNSSVSTTTTSTSQAESANEAVDESGSTVEHGTESSEPHRTSSDAVTPRAQGRTTRASEALEEAAGKDEGRPDPKLADQPDQDDQIDRRKKSFGVSETSDPEATAKTSPRDAAVDAAEPTEHERKKRTKPEDASPRAFNYLPDAVALAEAMSDLHERSKSAKIPLHVMAIRFDRDTGKATTRALLQIVRATLRSVDRIGCDDQCTLLVCMPNLDADSAMERGQQICRAVGALSAEDTEGEKPCQVNVGLANAADDDDFSQVVSRVKQAAEMARSGGESVHLAE